MSDLIFSLVIILAIAFSALCAGVSSGLFSLNKYQLKHKAQLGDKDAKTVYSLYGDRYRVMSTLLIGNILANTTIVVMINTKVTGLFAVLISTILILMFGELLPMVYLKKNVVFVAARIAPALQRVVLATAPVTNTLAKVFDKWIGNDTQIFYSKEELLRMFDGQKLANSSDIAVDEARMIRKILEFGDKKIRDVMTPRRMAKVVQVTDSIGPILMDELHGSGHSRFPVRADDKNYNFVGTLYMRDLAMEKSAKIVQDIMSQDVYYVHEQESLDHALRAFLRKKHHLFVVVNNFEEFVGVLSLEDILEEIIGKEIVDEFDQHDDLRAVAKSLAAKEKKNREKTKSKLSK